MSFLHIMTSIRHNPDIPSTGILASYCLTAYWSHIAWQYICPILLDSIFVPYCLTVYWSNIAWQYSVPYCMIIYYLTVSSSDTNVMNQWCYMGTCYSITGHFSSLISTKSFCPNRDIQNYLCGHSESSSPDGQEAAFKFLLFYEAGSIYVKFSSIITAKTFAIIKCQCALCQDGHDMISNIYNDGRNLSHFTLRAMSHIDTYNNVTNRTQAYVTHIHNGV